MLTHTLLASLVILGVSASAPGETLRRRVVPYDTVYNGAASSEAAAPSEAYGGLVSNGYGQYSNGQGSHPTATHTKEEQGGHQTKAFKTRIKAWQPQDGLFFVDEKKLEKTKAYVKEGVTVVMATGTASAPGMTASAKVADFQIYYKNQRLEGVAGYNKGGKGAPVELYDVLHCKGKGKARKCVLIDYDGSTIASSKTTVVTGTQHKIKATKLVKVPKFYTEGAIPGQVATVVYPAGEQANGSGQASNSNSVTVSQAGAAVTGNV